VDKGPQRDANQTAKTRPDCLKALLFDDGGRSGLRLMLTAAEQRRAQHHCGSVENHDDDKPAQQVEVQFLDDIRRD